MQKMKVTVPPGVSGGQMLKVQTPAGLMQVAVPQGLQPGQDFEMMVVYKWRRRQCRYAAADAARDCPIAHRRSPRGAAGRGTRRRHCWALRARVG